MQKKMKDRKELLKQLRAKKITLRAEKTDMYNKALGVNPGIAAKRKELEGLYAKRSAFTKEIDAIKLKRRALGEDIDAKRAEINTLNATKATMFTACGTKKAEILEIDKQIMQCLADIRHMRGRDIDWKL